LKTAGGNVGSEWESTDAEKHLLSRAKVTFRSFHHWMEELLQVEHLCTNSRLRSKRKD
jgi:hypothetical protein